MRAAYDQLLEAALRHVQELKRRGVRYLAVSPDTLATLDAVPRLASRSLAPEAARPARPSTPRPVETPQLPPTFAVSAGNQPAPIPEPIQEAGAPMTREFKAAKMTELRERALACQRCAHLARSRRNVVFGVGDIHSPLMFVGEAPGADEDVQGEPFVGAAGQLLTKIIQTMGFSRGTVYIANILKCRPDTPGQAFGNRRPTSDEMKECLPYLLAQIDLIQPKVIVALGATAMEGLFGKPVTISRARGRFTSFRDTPVMPTYHPSYLLRNPALSVKREVWEDMLQVLEKLARPIHDKQRNYFLKAS